MEEEGDYTDENNEKSKYAMCVAKKKSIVIQPNGCSAFLQTFQNYEHL